MPACCEVEQIAAFEAVEFAARKTYLYPSALSAELVLLNNHCFGVLIFRFRNEQIQFIINESGACDLSQKDLGTSSFQKF